MDKSLLRFILASCMLIMMFPMYSMAQNGTSYPSQKHRHITAEAAVHNIVTLQAYTDFTWYGQKLTRVEITYEKRVDLSSLTPESYVLLDRGYATPDFEEVTIDSVEVRGRKVTLNVSTDTEALDSNSLIYVGDDAEGSRTKNPKGLYPTGPWYRDVNGVIHADGDGYAAREIGEGGFSPEGYQTRESLELKLYHAGESESDAACLANEDGSYNGYGLWLPTVDLNYGHRGFRSFEELGINVPTTATDGDDYVKGWAYFPKEFYKKGHHRRYQSGSDKKYPLIVTITGYGTSYWKLPDGTNNFGTGLNFDGSGIRWMGSGAIVLNIHDRSHTGGDGYQFWVDDYNVIQYFIDNYNVDPEDITLTGNSRGTIACNTITAAYPGLVKNLILNNGSMGAGIPGGAMFDAWTEADWQNAANYGTRIWTFDGELDTNNIESYQTAVSYYREAGWTDEWIADNIRLTGFPTELYYYWGETDHSTTKMTYYYFFDTPYYGPDCEIVDGELYYNSMQSAGETYQLWGRFVDGSYNKYGFDYVIYGDSLKEWVLSPAPVTARSLDDREFPEYDYTRANKLPAEMTGYWEKSFDVDGITRTAKVYISAETPIRSYYTVIAVPDGVDTADFLEESGWFDTADTREEGLFVLEPGESGWGNYEDEIAYVNAAMGFYASNSYFSIFGEHYFVGYGAGAPALEAWAVANPLKVISQVYFDSEGLPVEYIDQYAYLEYGGENGHYAPIEFPDDFQKLLYRETVLPTWYINPKRSASESIGYWRAANDCHEKATRDRTFGRVYEQVKGSERWMTSYMGPISKVALLKRPVSYYDPKILGDVQDFMYYYSRYENAVAYANQLVIRANFKELGIEIYNMEVNGDVREYMIYAPDSAVTLWGDAAPVLFVWAGNSQTDKVFIDATSWWKVAREEGIILVVPCEQYSSSSVSVSHRDNELFFQQLRDVVLSGYGADPTRLYSTGQSAGSMASQSFAVARPEYFAAVASTSGPSYPDEDGNVRLDGFSGEYSPASYSMIPNYMIYGAGDISFFAGSLWDSEDNNLDLWAAYFLEVNGAFELGEESQFTVSGWFDRFNTWTWTKEFDGVEVPLFKVSKNLFRSHNCIHEEMPLLWDYLKHFSIDTPGGGKRYYSPSAFTVAGDAVEIN